MPSSFSGFAARIVTALTLSLALVACGHGQHEKRHGTEKVSVVTLKAQQVPLTTQLPGRVTAFRIAQVRPQVSGIILKRDYKEGSHVKAGQLLYQIDPAPYQARYDNAKASLMNAQASLKAARLKAQRYKPLARYRAVSKLQLADAEASAQQAAANVAAAKAALETAHINLRYTKVRSPIAGRSGRSNVTEGALVTSDQSQTLTTVQQLDPVYVDVTQPSNVLLRLEREYANGQLRKVGKKQAQVHLILSDGTAYTLPGKLQFSDVTVDPNTGSVTLRAIFPNPRHVLLPGMFVHMRINEGISPNALLVPQQGVTHNAEGQATALIVDKHDKVVLRVLKVRRAIGNHWLVSAGLHPGDRVIVSGLQHIHPGDKVIPEPAPKDYDENHAGGPAHPASASSTIGAN